MQVGLSLWDSYSRGFSPDRERRSGDFPQPLPCIVVFRPQALDQVARREHGIDGPDALATTPDIFPGLGTGVAAAAEIHLRGITFRQVVRIQAGGLDRGPEVVAVYAGEPVGIDDVRRGAVDNALLERIAEGQERMATLLEARDPEAGGLDAETRARLRSIDTQVLRILEDLAAGRQDLVTEIRQDIAGLAEALRAIAARGRL